MQRLVKISTLKLSKYDARFAKHYVENTSHGKSLLASIKDKGLLNPIMIDKDFNVIDGYCRVIAMKKLNFKHTFCNITEKYRR